MVSSPATPRRVRHQHAHRSALLFALTLLVADAAWPADVLARSGVMQLDRHPKQRRQTGFASFYGPESRNRRTANGERFDPGQLTAAHRTLPFGTRVKVTNLDNDRHVIVRINDRGPYARGRVLDLSRAAARKLGFEREGVAYVRLEVLKGWSGERMADDMATPWHAPWHSPAGESARPRSSKPATSPKPKGTATRKPSTGRA